MLFPKPPLPKSLEQVVQRFQRLSDPKQRFEQLLWYARRLPAFPKAEKVPENKVPGCVSQVYITCKVEEGKLWFMADSDAQLTKGLAAILVEGLSGLTPTEILQFSPEFIQDTGLTVSLTPSRTNGFYNIVTTMKQKALKAEAMMAATASTED